MALPSSGSPISFDQIRNEFGVTPNKKLGEYRISQNVGDMTGLPLDDGIPQGDSQISFSQFYGTQLNIVVEYDENQNEPPSAKKKFNDNAECTVIGGFKSKPDKSNGSRIIIHTSNSANIGGKEDNNIQNRCSLKTGGGWEATTELDIVIGSQSTVYGSGGNGGRGGDGGVKNEEKAAGKPGNPGGSAIGIQYPVDTIKVYGQVRAGGGGGGGGGGTKNDQSETRGSGGGGGAGKPAGKGGEKGGGDGNGGRDGEDGTKNTAGNGADGSEGAEVGQEDSVTSGGGGGGGAPQAAECGSGGERPENDDNSELNGNPGTPPNPGIGFTGGGGAGIQGNAEGQQQVEGSAGLGGLNGYSITSTNNYVINVTVGDDNVYGLKKQNGGVS